MIADDLARKVHNWSNERVTIQVWSRWDGAYRAVELHRIGESSRYREVRGKTFQKFPEALDAAREWEDSCPR